MFELGAWMFPLTDLDAMLQDVSLRGISIDQLIPHQFSIDEAAEAWRSFDAGSLGKTVITRADSSAMGVAPR